MEVVAVDAEELHRRAQQALSMNLHGEAQRLCEEALAACPENVDYQAICLWIRAQARGADLTALVVELDVLLADNADHVASRYYRGMLRRRLGTEAAARMDFERVLSIDSGHSGARQQLAEMKTSKRA